MSPWSRPAAVRQTQPTDFLERMPRDSSALCLSVFSFRRRSERREGSAGGWNAGRDDPRLEPGPQSDPGGLDDARQHGAVSTRAVRTPSVPLIKALHLNM